MWHMMVAREPCDIRGPHPGLGVFKGHRALQCSVQGESLSEEVAAPWTRLRLRTAEFMERMEKNPRTQATQGPLLSLRRRQSVSDEAGRSGQRMERARIFALPREPSPSHDSSSSSSSRVPIKLPPVHLGQPKVGPKNLQLRTVPEVQPRQPQAAPQGSRSQVLSLSGDRLPPLPPVPLVPRPPALPRLVSPRDTESRGTELGSAGEKGPQSCSPCPPQPYTPLPRVRLPRLWVGREDAFYISPSQQLPPVPPIRTGAAAMEHSLRGTVPQRPSDSKCSKEENGSYKSLFQVIEEFELSQEDSQSEQELSQVEEATEVASEDSTSDQQLSPVEEDIEVAPEDTTNDQELFPKEYDCELFEVDSTKEEPLSQVQEAIELSSGDSNTQPQVSKEVEAREVTLWDSTSVNELSPVEEDIEVGPENSSSDKELSPGKEAFDVTPEDSRSDMELSPGEEAIDVTPEDSRSVKELSPGEEAIEVVLADSTSDHELFQVEEAIVVLPKDNPCDEELSSVEQTIQVGPEDSTRDQELSKSAEAIDLFPGDSMSGKELSAAEENHEEEASLGESERDNELPHGDYYKDQRLSPDDVEFETDLCFGEDSDLQDKSPWEADDCKLLSLWEEGEQEEPTRRALLGDRDRDPSLSLELPELEDMLRHRKVLEWLEPNVLNHCGFEEEEETEACVFQRLPKLKRRKEKLEARQKELLGTEEAAEAAPALPSASRALRSPTDSELAAVTPGRATEEEEEPAQALAAQDKKAAAPSVLSEDCTSLGTRSTRKPLSKAVPQMQALRQRQQHALEQRVAAEGEAAVAAGREGSSVHSSPRPWPAQLGAQALRGQPAAPRKRPSRFRRALRALGGLFRWPCLRPRPEE